MNIAGRLTLVAGLIAASSADAEIRVTGNHRVDRETIVSNFKDPSRKPTDRELNEVLKALYSTGQFDDVSVNRAGVDVVVAVKEAPLVARVRFVGNSRLDDKKLSARLKTGAGLTYKAADLQDDVGTISAAYDGVARSDALVRQTVVPLEDNRVEVLFTINEGERVGISNVWFKGNETYSEAELRSVIATKQSGVFSWFLNNDFYDVDRVASDREKLRQYYVSKGFPAARVLLSDVDRFPEGYVVGFVVDEGPRYSIASAQVESTIPGYDGARAGVGSLKGKLYTPQAVNRVADQVAEDTLKAGIPDAVVSARLNSNAEGSADVTFAVDAGPRLYVQRIDVEGNTKTRDYVIRRELDFSEGDMLNKPLIARAERRLKALGLFDKVSISVGKGDADDKALVKIEVAEKKTGEWSIGGGYSTTDGPLFSASIAQSNLFGTGRSVRIGAGKGDNNHSFNFSVAEPFLFGNRVTAETSLIRRDGEREIDGRRTHDEALTGARFALTAPVSEYVDATIFYGLSHRQVSDVASRYSGRGTASDPDLISKGDFLKPSIGYKLTYDGLDDRFNPKDGWHGTFGQEFAGVGGDVRFVKTEASTDWYTQLIPTSDVVGHIGGKAGHISGLGEPLDFAEHFRTGTSTVRGFAEDGFGPRDTASGYHLGGTFLVSGTAEAIMPIPLIPQEYGFKGVAFTDFGTVWNADTRRVEQSGSVVSSPDAKLRASIGTGILWNSPFGQIRADFAVPVVKENGDDTQVFSFSGGTHF